MHCSWKRKINHTSVINRYTSETNELMKGKRYYCASWQKNICANIGVLEVLTDCQEKAFILKTSLFGTYKKTTSWESNINTDILPDCPRCSKQRKEMVSKDYHDISSLNRCRQCWQWDLVSTSTGLRRNLITEIYPMTCSPTSPDPPIHRTAPEKYLVLVKQMFKFLFAAALFAAYSVAEGVWTRSMTDTNLWTCAIVQFVRDYV